MGDKIEERIINVMSAVFEIPANKIGEESSPDNIESWDSLKHMNMVVALEEEFNIQFTDDELIELINMKLIMVIIREKLSGNAK
jgi:acyl carrier protein